MAEALDSRLGARVAGLPLANAYEALTLASIVEKETGLASERPHIAGVFMTRLRRNMRLQTDPTVIYGIGATYDGNIRERDLRTDTPYNTYTRARTAADADRAAVARGHRSRGAAARDRRHLLRRHGRRRRFACVLGYARSAQCRGRPVSCTTERTKLPR